MLDPDAPVVPVNQMVAMDYPGLTIRQHFACQALMGLLAGCQNVTEFQNAPKRAVQKADELIAELNKE